MLCGGNAGCDLQLPLLSTSEDRQVYHVKKSEGKRGKSFSLSLSGVRQEDWGTEVGGNARVATLSCFLSSGQVEWRDQVGACVSDEQT